MVELVEQLKQGRWLVLEALTSRRQPHIVVIPLAGFAEAYDGPPTPTPKMKERMASPAGMNTARGPALVFVTGTIRK
ncbi:MAG: invasion associated locus B family protein [Xanthobacteraceae bacterium]|nr:invasion associated locus B family protein [Xanthobacteraceae bacterium]